MRTARVVNVTRGTVLAERAQVADSFLSRFLGLMCKRPLAPGEGLVLRPGGAVHNFFVFQSIDVLHLDDSGKVGALIQPLRPWRVGPLRVPGAATVELPPGAAEASGTRPGDRVDILPSS